ncbi:unnamed protein product [Hermetia illucens]|uniref:OAR domain-containing protein n=1 Tax=Hermetia illucens TaxID=343691 RepID=A0A7R8YZ70_HERIL|nr:unnamed protein product [Hermetia illucens]
MHRKSLEAAEALKNEDSANSDRDETTSKCSDKSSSGNKTHRSSPCGTSSCPPPPPPHSQQSSQHASSTITVRTSSPASSTSSSPIDVQSSQGSPPQAHMHHLHPSHHHQQQHQSQHSHHNDVLMDGLNNSNKELNLVVNSSPPLSAPGGGHLVGLHHPVGPPGFHPDQDPEIFRWVHNYRTGSMIRNNSIACLRAKAQEHQARLLNSGLLLQVRSLAGLNSPAESSNASLSPQHVLTNCDSNGNLKIRDECTMQTNLTGSSAIQHSPSPMTKKISILDDHQTQSQQQQHQPQHQSSVTATNNDRNNLFYQLKSELNTNNTISCSDM